MVGRLGAQRSPYLARSDVAAAPVDTVAGGGLCPPGTAIKVQNPPSPACRLSPALLPCTSPRSGNAASSPSAFLSHHFLFTPAPPCAFISFTSQLVRYMQGWHCLRRPDTCPALAAAHLVAAKPFRDGNDHEHDGPFLPKCKKYNASRQLTDAIALKPETINWWIYDDSSAKQIGGGLFEVHPNTSPSSLVLHAKGPKPKHHFVLGLTLAKVEHKYWLKSNETCQIAHSMRSVRGATIAKVK